MRSILALATALVIAACVGVTTASADPGNHSGQAPASPAAPTTTYGFIPDPGVTITTDPSKLTGHVDITPGPAGKARSAVSPFSNCGTCVGGGDVSGCATVYTNNGDGYGNWVKAYYHWCWLNGSVSNNYGWGDEAACWAVCNFQGWNYNFDFGYGHQDKATFRDVSGGIFHIDSADATCVAVDGWGNAWGC
ncbi:MAG TPA: hypothetical protein VHC67_12340 [Gaiellaceae bacterium]|nr:hypothetical protein [Gaiellaceae bacterium]